MRKDEVVIIIAIVALLGLIVAVFIGDAQDGISGGSIIEIDNCQYIKMDGGLFGNATITHLATCPCTRKDN